MIQTLIRPGEYRDSVALMLLARELGGLPGVSDVSVVMGTPANKALLQQAGIDGATIVTTMARNGADFGIRLAGLPG